MPSPSTRSAALAGAVLLAAAACSGGGNDPYRAAGNGAVADTLTISQQDETRDLLSIDPLKTMDVSLPTTAVFDTLLHRGDDGRAEPQLVESYSQDAQGWRLRLRSGVTFTDGSALDSEDVKATIDHLLDPANATSYSRILAGSPEPGWSTRERSC